VIASLGEMCYHLLAVRIITNFEHHLDAHPIQRR
jgi:hypothetical protein